MSKFIQIHSLTVHGPSNLNRDESGRPKVCSFGGVPRLRISSQSLKRSWRTGSVFQAEMGSYLSTRTRRIGETIVEHLVARGHGRDESIAAAKVIAAQFGKLPEKPKDNGRDLDTEQLAFISSVESARALELAERIVKGETLKESEINSVLGATDTAVDIAMFGRMLAADPIHNVEAAVHVAHAITTHRALTEDDYYVAADDKNRGDEDSGAGFVGTAEFGSGVFYSYACIDRGLLEGNLAGNVALASRGIQALVRGMVEDGPTAKISSFASVALPSFLLIEKGDRQPRNLMSAFIAPIGGDDQLSGSVTKLLDMRDKLDKVFGAAATDSSVVNALTGDGSLADAIEFAAA